MRRVGFLLALVGVLGLSALAGPADADVKKESSQKLVGTWKVVSAERDGKGLDAF